MTVQSEINNLYNIILLFVVPSVSRNDYIPLTLNYVPIQQKYYYTSIFSKQSIH